MKSPIVIFNFISLFIIYFFIQRLWNKKTALLTTLLIALHPLLIAFSQHTQGDTTLWNTMFITILAFFIYLKTGKLKYIIITSLFFALAVLSKFFGMILYPLLFVFLYGEYFFNRLSVKEFKNRFIGLIAIYVLLIIFVFILYPQCHTNFRLALDSTFLHNTINSINSVFPILALLLTLEVFLMKGKISKVIKKYKIEKFTTIFLLSIMLLLVLTAVLPARMTNFLQSKQGYFGGVHTTSYTSSFLLFARSLIAIIPWYIFILQIAAIIKALVSKSEFKHGNILIYSILLSLSFLYAAMFGMYQVWVKYLLFLIPPIYLSTTLVFVENFRKIKIFIPIALIVLLIGTAEVATVYPTYFSHRNNFIPLKNGNIYDGNYGGYEAAQVFNKLPQADTMKTISDTYGFYFFAKGYKSFLPENFTEEMLKNYDFAYLSSFGKKEKSSWAMLPYSMRLLYDMPKDSALFFIGNEYSYAKLQKIPKYNYKFVPENHFDTDFFVEMNKNHSISFWLEAYNSDSLNTIITFARNAKDVNTIRIDSSQIVMQHNDSILTQTTNQNNKLQHICFINKIRNGVAYNTLYINGVKATNFKCDNIGEPLKGIFINIPFSNKIQDLRIYNNDLSNSQLRSIIENGEMQSKTVLIADGQEFRPVRHFTRK